MTQMYADIDSICVDLRNLRIKLFLLFIPGSPGGALVSKFNVQRFNSYLSAVVVFAEEEL